jgi:hypothetical protein
MRSRITPKFRCHQQTRAPDVTLRDAGIASAKFLHPSGFSPNILQKLSALPELPLPFLLKFRPNRNRKDQGIDL